MVLRGFHQLNPHGLNLTGTIEQGRPLAAPPSDRNHHHLHLSRESRKGRYSLTFLHQFQKLRQTSLKATSAHLIALHVAYCVSRYQLV